jgi:hypothetical protein
LVTSDSVTSKKGGALLNVSVRVFKNEINNSRKTNLSKGRRNVVHLLNLLIQRPSEILVEMWLQMETSLYLRATVTQEKASCTKISP